MELENRYSIIDKEEIFKTLVNTSDSGKMPYHRWGRYREGFSSKLVGKMIDTSSLSPQKQFIMDPMCGSGSTLIGASQLGYDSLGVDISPYSVKLTNIKFTHFSDEQIKVMKDFIGKPIDVKPMKYAKSDMSVYIDEVEGYFNSENFLGIQKIVAKILDVEDPSIRDFLFMAWLTILEDCSDRKKDGNGLAPRPTRVKDTWTRFQTQVLTFLDDLTNAPFNPDICSKAYQGNAMDLSSLVKDYSNDINKQLGMILFSPPYANSFDYFESYKLELVCGGYYHINELPAARNGAIRGYRKGYGKPLKTDDFLLNGLCEEIRERIPIKEKETGTIDNRTRLVPNLIIGYFNDISDVIHDFMKYMPLDSPCHIVVDQSSYLGVVIPTDTLIAHIAEATGFKVHPIIRCRKANTSVQQLTKYPYLKRMLRESIVSFTRE